MSHEPSHSTEHLPPPPAQADERVATGKIIAVGIISLAVFAAATWWASRIWQSTTRRLEPEGPIPVGREVGKPEIGIVDQVPFEVARGAELYRQQQREWLNSYGWIDRDKGIIHVPIEKAIDQYLAQQGKKQ